MAPKPLLAGTWLGLILAGCSSNSGPPSSAQSDLPAVRSTTLPIKNVVVIIQENRSLVNFFAGYPGANAPAFGCATADSPSELGSRSCPAGDVSVPLHEDTFEGNQGELPHDWSTSIKDWNGGRMDGFAQGRPKSDKDAAYAYIERSEIRPYWTMARRYVLADEMFPTEFGGSFTGHLTLVAGTDDLKPPSKAEVDFPSSGPYDCDSSQGTTTSYLTTDRKIRYNGPFPCFDQFNTMAQVLDSARVSWKFYAFTLLNAGMWEPFEAIKYVRYGPDWNANIVAPETTVLNDARHGRLSSVSWVTPNEKNSDHPAAQSDTGPSWVASVVNAIGASKYWNTSAIIVTWDDWGGFYDNAAPPQLDYRGLGIRVPCLIISPYAKRGHVSHVQYEYGSILRFIEEVNGITPGSIGPTSLGYTDARANSLDDAFDFTRKPRKFSKIPSKYPLEYFLHQPPSDTPLDTQ